MMDKETIVITTLVIILFAASIIIGIDHRETTLQLAKSLYGMGDYFTKDHELTIYTKTILFLIIWIRNTIVATLNIALGPILGLFPIFTVFFNGYLIGGLTSIAAEKASLEFALAGVLPHGVIELPTFLYSAIVGLKLAKRALESGFKGKELTNYYVSMLKKIPKIIIPLFLIAAFIEAFITTAILSSLI